MTMADQLPSRSDGLDGRDFTGIAAYDLEDTNGRGKLGRGGGVSMPQAAIVSGAAGIPWSRDSLPLEVSGLCGTTAFPRRSFARTGSTGSDNLGRPLMNWDRIQGNWKMFKGQVQQKWGDLTNDDLDRIEGNRTELIGRLQARYGMARDEAERQVDSWSDTLT
jgi:uncharacterized protein YjbJ (UPF0337 family)